MAFPEWFNFSGTGYAASGQFAVTSTSVGSGGYPTTSTASNTVGWEDGVDVLADRNTGLDERLRGVAVTFATQDRFRVDISAGDYIVRCAAGDSSLGGSVYLDVQDTTTSRAVIANQTGLASTDFVDATNTIRTSATDWVNNNAPSASLTFSTGILRFVNGNGADVRKVAAVFVDAAVTATAKRFLSLLGAGA